MSTQPPVVPPGDQSDKGSPGAEDAPKDAAKAAPANSDKTGRQGNAKINTTLQGHRQDR